MSVHTLREKDGMLQIGAAITKGEAPAAGVQILRFCYREAGLTPPIVLDAPDTRYAAQATSSFGDLVVDGDRVVLITTCMRCGHGSARRAEPTQARASAAVIAAMADYAQTTPDPDQVELVAAVISELGRDSDPEKLADALLRRFNLEERAA